MTQHAFYEILTQVQIDHYLFQVTWSVASGESCILWICDETSMQGFEALGRFSHFDKRDILEFIVRYVSNPSLQEEISKRRFEHHLEHLPTTVFEEIDRMDFRQKEEAFRNLFNLDSVIDKAVDLGWKRRIMAKKFHPDSGGSHKSMTIINEGYDLLSSGKKTS
ncbi:hypothetical protein [Desulfohalobium retbaense]|nr:hypothetical protein [Desulfohalobium retbaense]